MGRNKFSNYTHIPLQAHISRLENHFSKWRMKVNPNKSQEVLFSKKSSLPPLLGLNRFLVEFDWEAMYLDIILHSKITGRKQIEKNV